MKYISRINRDAKPAPWAEGGMTATEVICDDDSPKDTGLYDPSGNRIYRVRGELSFGFVSGKAKT